MKTSIEVIVPGHDSRNPSIVSRVFRVTLRTSWWWPWSRPTIEAVEELIPHL